MRRVAKAPSAGSSSGVGGSRGLFGRAFAVRGAFSDADGSGAPSTRGFGFRPGAPRADSDATRIAAPRSATATPGTCREGGARREDIAATAARLVTPIASPQTTSAFRLPTYPQEEWAGRKAFASADFDTTTTKGPK